MKMKLKNGKVLKMLKPNLVIVEKNLSANLRKKTNMRMDTFEIQIR